MKRSRKRVLKNTIIGTRPKTDSPHRRSERPNEGLMACGRCGGCVVARHFVGGRDWEYDGWECLICGNIIDPLITSNREAQSSGLRRLMSGKGMRGAGGAVAIARQPRFQR